MSWLTNWNYRKPITISNTGSTLTDHQVLVTVDTLALAGNIQVGCADIRFTDNGGIIPLSYWIESGPNTTSTKIWVKISSIANGNNTIYLYYGNSGAPSASNGTNTFNFFDDFLSSTIDNSKWTWSAAPGNVYGTATLSISNSILTLTGGLNTNWILRADKVPKSAFPFIIEYYAKTSESPSNHGAIVGASDFQIDAWGRNSFSFGDAGTPGKLYRSVENGVTTTNARTTTSTSYTRTKIIERSGGIDFYENNIPTNTITTNSPEVDMGAWMYVAQSPGVVNVDWVFIRKYASPEPALSTTGTEELGITAYSMYLYPSETPCRTGICTVRADVVWQNLGSSSVTFRPKILIDGVTYVQAASDITIVGAYPAISSTIQITTPTLPAGNHTICPYPN